MSRDSELPFALPPEMENQPREKLVFFRLIEDAELAKDGPGVFYLLVCGHTVWRSEPFPGQQKYGYCAQCCEDFVRAGPKADETPDNGPETTRKGPYGRRGRKCT
jgi:hypothetical protein